MVSIEQFGERHIESAGRMFVEQYKLLRKENYLLPEKFADENIIQSMLKGIIAEQPAVVAIMDGEVAGYLVGYAGIQSFKSSSSGIFVPAWGHCIGTQRSMDRIFSALYTEISAEWVRRQCYMQAISFIAPNPALQELLYILGFGLLLIDGIREMKHLDTKHADDIEIRMARESDITDLMVIDRKLCQHLRESPIFLNFSTKNDIDKARESFLAEDIGTFIAKDGNEIVSCIRGKLNMGPGCDLFDVDGSLGINFAYTNSNARGKGLAALLLNELLNWGVSQGMERCVVDFESANLLGKHFWMRHFGPICYSVIRKIDDRI